MSFSKPESSLLNSRFKSQSILLELIEYLTIEIMLSIAMKKHFII